MKGHVLIVLIHCTLLVVSGCAYRRGCNDPDPTPSHTFGEGGIYQRDGRLLPPRRHCPTCNYLGMTCPKCQATCDTNLPATPEPSDQLKADKPADDADELIRMLKTNPLPSIELTRDTILDDGSDSEKAGDGDVQRRRSPYAPIHSRAPLPPWAR